MEEQFSSSLCEAEFARIGLRFWTGDSVEPLPLDIHTAASVGDLKYIQDLPKEEFDRPNHGSWTPLMYSSYLGHRKLCLFFISQGCDACKSNAEGRTPLMLGAMCGNIEVVKDIITIKDKDKALSQADKRNFTALSHAVFGGHLDLAEFLLSRGSNPNTTEHEKGYSLLMLAASQGNRDMVDILLDGGADAMYQNVVGDTAMSVSQARGHQEVSKVLRRYQFSKTESLSVLDGPARAQLLMQKKLLEDRDSMTVEQFLAKLGLAQYIDMFRAQEIDFQLLLTLSDQDLKNIGVVLLGPRRKLTTAISKWNCQHQEDQENEKIIS